MAGTTKTSSTAATLIATSSPKQNFLDAYHREHAITMKLLRAYPADKLNLKPHAKLRTARELAWVFVMERVLGTAALNNEFVSRVASGAAPPPPPESWDQQLAALEKAHNDFASFIHQLPDDKLNETVKFFGGPKTLTDYRRIDLMWFLLHDQIHHRGQFSIYLRIADGKVPSIYGPSADEPWT